MNTLFGIISNFKKIISCKNIKVKIIQRWIQLGKCNTTLRQHNIFRHKQKNTNKQTKDESSTESGPRCSSNYVVLRSFCLRWVHDACCFLIVKEEFEDTKGVIRIRFLFVRLIWIVYKNIIFWTFLIWFCIKL